MKGGVSFGGRGFTLVWAAVALCSLFLVWVGLYAIPRPAYPTMDDAARACGNCTSRVEVSLQFEKLVLGYGRTTFVARSIAQVGIGGLFAAPVALLIYPRRRDFLRTGNSTARSWGQAALAAGLLAFIALAFADIYYANTGDKTSVAFFAISWVESILGNQSFGLLGAVVLVVAAAGGTVSYGLRSAVIHVIAPASFAFSLGLLLFDWKEISIHATDFLAGISANHTDLVSNWTLLAAAGILTALGALDACRTSLAGGRSWRKRASPRVSRV